MYKPGDYVHESKLERHRVPNGYEWQFGRITKTRTTRRPPTIFPELWTAMSKKQQQAAIDEWKKTNQFEIVNNGDVGAAAMNLEPLESTSGGVPSTRDEWGEIPAMPVLLRPPGHRQKLNHPCSHDGIALVARSVSVKEAATNPKAKAAEDAEWNDLRRMQTWDESTVMEWGAVKNRAKAENRRVHV